MCRQTRGPVPTSRFLMARPFTILAMCFFRFILGVQTGTGAYPYDDV